MDEKLKFSTLRIATPAKAGESPASSSIYFEGEVMIEEKFAVGDRVSFPFETGPREWVYR